MAHHRVGILLVIGFALGAWSEGAIAATDAQKCIASKSKVVGKYYLCLMKADAKAVLTATLPDYSKCATAFDAKWSLAESKIPGACPDNVPLPTPMNAYVQSQEASAEAIIAGTQNIPTCGDNVINQFTEQCDGTDLGAASCSSLGFGGGTLACVSCLFDTSACAGGCPAGLTSCSGSCRDLAVDESNCGTCGNVCATGQICISGSCGTSCPPGLFNCAGVCRNVTTDSDNCGGCATVCASGYRCASAFCQLSCQAGLTSCSGTCRDLLNDCKNCGSCGNMCPPALDCVAGTCM